MIARYSRPKMAAIWSEEAQFRTWLDIEILACEGWAKLGKIPSDALKEIQDKASFDIVKIQEIEKETKHDVAAFVSNVQSQIGQAGRYVHLGLTSSDILDTALAYRMTKSAEIIIEELNQCLEVTKKNALRDKLIPMMGRTHGIHAEPMTMGLKWLLWHDMLKRSKTRIIQAKNQIAVGKLSGAVGNYAHVPPEVEKYVCDKLSLKPDSLSTQVISRDRFANYYSVLGLLGSCVEAIAVELRHLQRTELSEVREGFSAGQKGSSAMPHKRNPISAENLTGIARLLRGMVIPAMENIALWHERDISHSAVERVIAPDANILTDYMLGRLNQLLSNLEIFPDKMKSNLEQLHGVVFSQKALLLLIDRGCSRDEAYAIIQKNALLALDTKQPLLLLLKSDSSVKTILGKESAADLEKLFDPHCYFQHLDYLYEKVLNQ